MAPRDRDTYGVPLAAVPRGAAVDIVALPVEEAAPLLGHGVRPGVRLVVDGDAPFGGPRIVRLGRTRIAIDRRLTRSILVERVEATPAGGRP